MKTPIVNTRVKTIVNPYDFRRSFRELKPYGVIEGYTLVSNGKLSHDTNYKIVIYRVFANFAALKFLPDKIVGFAYYTDNVLLRMRKTVARSDNDNINIYQPLDYLGSDLGGKEDADFQYYCHNLGRCISSKTEKVEIKDKYVIPREIFIDINDSAYLFICAKKEEDIYITHSSFPEGQPFFWDTPVATSLFVGQKLEKSDILLGSIKVIKKVSVLSKEQRYIEKNISCSYKWDNGKKVVWNGKNLITQRVRNTCMVFPEKATCSVMVNNVLYSASLSLKVFVYQKYRKVNENDVTAYVWCSGNEDDLVKKTYLESGMSCQAAYNRYPFILDSLSLNTIYHSFASLTHVSEGNAARYIVRYIAQQPKGLRSISIEGYLVYLMGGALCWIGETLSNNKKHKSDDQNAVDSLGENMFMDDASGNEQPIEEDFFEKTLMPRIESMFTINGSKLYFDSPVRYPADYSDVTEANSFAVEYLRNILGIKEGMSGCSKLGDLLRTLFDNINKFGLSIDYVYCDIEKLFNDAWMLKVQRVDEHYLEAKAEEIKGLGNDDDESTDNDIKSQVQAKIYQGFWDEIRGCLHPEIYSQMKSLGFYNEGRGVQIGEQCKADAKASEKEKWNVLYDIYKVTEGKEYYGIANSKSYERRRNLNIWDVVMKNYMNKLFYDYVVTPVQTIFNNAKCSCYSHTHNKGYINHADKWETYLGGSLMLGGDMYSSISLYGNYYSKGIRKLSMDNWKILPDVTPYTFFVDYVNKVRSSFLSSPQHHFNVFISSWNIWAYELNKELHFFKNNNINGEEQEEKAKNQQLYKSAQTYHKELLYHTFLLNPDKAIAYFNLEPKRRKDDAENYLVINEKSYYTESYKYLQGILQELNQRFTGGKIIPQTATLAIETEPYVLTCAEVNGKWHWRLTVNEEITPIVEKSSVSFTIGGWKIVFHQIENNPLVDNDCNKVGFWIVTPVGEKPQITSEIDSYFKNPATEFSMEEIGNEIQKEESKLIVRDSSGIKYKPFSCYTLFGEAPQIYTTSMRFSIENHIKNNEEYLLWGEKFTYPECNDSNTNAYRSARRVVARIKIDERSKILFEIAGKSIEPIGDYPSKGELARSTTYELKLFAYINNLLRGKISGSIRYELYSDTGDMLYAAKSKIAYTSDNLLPYLSSEFYIVRYSSETKKEMINIEDFRIYFSGHQEKVELFRESNGLNISRVNKGVPAYADFDAAETFDDTIFAKVSWLNAEKRSIKYVLNISVGKISGGNIYPIDGRIINHYVDENDDLHFEVAPESEGYILVNLPNVSIKKGGKIRYELLADEQQVIQENIPLSNILKPKTI